MKKFILIFFIVIIATQLQAQQYSNKVVVGAERMEAYMPLLKNKKVALLVNQTSMVKNVHLVDTLLSLQVKIVRIYAPEHGFRGNASAGEKVSNSIDTKTNIPITSMYGATKQPKIEELKNIDIVVFDIQDVGARFYTYISSLQYMMEACAMAGKPLLILDRPNPNGFYVDGPIMQNKYKSFVGMQPIPIVHGMTVAEYAQMLNGEQWLKLKSKCKLHIITCENYDHNTLYNLPIAPSPNLKTPTAVLLYPSLCLFEGTMVSVGRGTDYPFEVWGHPLFKDNGFSFTPKSKEGAKDPLYENQTCYGANLSLPPDAILKIINKKLNLTFIKNAYFLTPDITKFFNSFFEKLTGDITVRYHIMQNKTDEEIRATWKENIEKFKLVRKKYLLYKDFE